MSKPRPHGRARFKKHNAINKEGMKFYASPFFRLCKEVERKTNKRLKREARQEREGSVTHAGIERSVQR
ncbi:hypothetical protein KW850_05380 [Bacillus sp. sid0103]|uniref:hypothetical protein n=1 Tax=Bacillus sp. sid0103 TaxID=2856337 RepID=UPI001C4371F9|nr:hypothetical protein [Bacillus sp. sid0103]MBV7504696.1 hypothetical protein [Bacillus sp. sid0103]